MRKNKCVYNDGFLVRISIIKLTMSLFGCISFYVFEGNRFCLYLSEPIAHNNTSSDVSFSVTKPRHPACDGVVCFGRSFVAEKQGKKAQGPHKTHPRVTQQKHSPLH